MYDVILSFITAFTLTYFAIPSIINVAAKKNLVDVPDERKSHINPTPSLGGIGIFAGVIFSIVLWTPFTVFGDLQYVLCSFIIVFLIGAKDDILPMAPWRKVAGEVFAAAILVVKSNVKLTSLYGIFGIYQIPDYVGIPLSIFAILVIINAFNLIDGINGLSGSISTLIALVLGTWFFLIDHLEMAIVAMALAGSTIAFLKYNITPAKIFMGDTGALLVGLICAILALQFIELHNELEGSPYAMQAVPAVAIGILIIPLFDTLRVFLTRIIRGRSPLTADRNHIHHLMIDCGMTHMKATSILVLANMLFILISYQFQHLGTYNLLLLILSLATFSTLGLLFWRRQVAQKRSIST
ncbi:MAG: undecaprenyl/decaprenyl-phosphate alpha-N-acetylglucosaminyl 1-phosphate transferase [Saprospiraceae bacterium]|nr:undecaprenyl/decaprenyl-phosphate alpha-N-acetylglucosaminyl 1-phosphate transferase [Saprospiraceae bacterium]